jgi:lipoprotein-anchoring transpeptidase ErfK/SrfK
LRESERLVRVGKRTSMPKWATGTRSWLDISLVRQTLVAYQGTTPRFVTLVSTGRDGTGDPATTHSTVQGVFLIHTKHVTATMSGDAADDEFDLRDVPYVQYFHEGYALHAAFWHDGFGGPRSHGCINLSPPDARYLFTWTDPPVPMRWHSALSREGTLVYVHP